MSSVPWPGGPGGAGLGRGRRREEGGGSARRDVSQGAFPGVEIEELRPRWSEAVLQSTGWNGRASRAPCLMHLQGLRRLMTQGGYDMVQKLFLDFFRRRLSQRPTAEELEQRNILKRK